MNEPIQFRRVTILGTGLMGGSFGLALRSHFPQIEITGYDRAETLERAKSRGAIQRSESDLTAAVRSADLVYIAMPIVPAIESLAAVAAAAPAHALVTDACSTKSLICRAAREHFKSKSFFLGGHPMAGKEASGVENADAELLRGGRYAFVAAGEDADPRVRAFVAVVREIGAEPVWCDADTHDWAAAIVSHLPQLLSVALARVVEDETDETGLPLALAGSGLRDALRLAASPYAVWRDICLTNNDNISHALDRLAQSIEYLRTHLRSRELEQEFLASNELYKTLHKLK
ncbi:MAG: prephenate dehydrogenase [Candidatus Acidiferrales bacterium]